MKIPKGYRFSGIVAGIKETGKKDLALIVSEVPAKGVGSLTTSLAPAAPVTLTRQVLRRGLCQAVIVNSGNANAATGRKGLRDARAMQTALANELSLSPKLVVVSSTGKIGTPLPIEKIKRAIPRALKQLSAWANCPRADCPSRFSEAAQAILTTDRSIKVGGFTGKGGGKNYSLVAFAKGAGMIEPHLKQVHMKQATMLAYFLTDLQAPRPWLQQIFNRSVEQSFNRITVDGDMSTNDTALLLANGMAKNLPLSSSEERDFATQLTRTMQSLARQMVADGEGATKVVRIEVKGARNNEEARRIAYVVGNSLLVKTSFFGEDPNWGRIVGAVARAGTSFRPDAVDIFYGPVCVARRGVATGPRAEGRAKKIMKQPEFTVTLDLHLGSGSHWIWASDLTVDYVKLNSNYRS